MDLSKWSRTLKTDGLVEIERNQEVTGKSRSASLPGTTHASSSTTLVLVPPSRRLSPVLAVVVVRRVGSIECTNFLASR